MSKSTPAAGFVRCRGKLACLTLLTVASILFSSCTQPAETPPPASLPPPASSRIAELETEIKSLKAQLDEAEEEISSLRSQLGEAQEELDSLRLIMQDREYWQKVRELLSQTLSGISEVRGLSSPAEIEFRVVTTNWAHEKWGRQYVEDNSKKIDIDDRIYKALFILPQESSLARLYAEWPRSYIATKWADRLYFVRENFGNLDGQEIRKTMSHEVVHFIQEKHFETPERSTYDGEKAWAALIEGDADFSRNKYLEEITESDLASQIGKLPGISQESAPVRERPLALTRLLYFPYDYGESFISALHQRGGWGEVNRAFRNPPVTTEQILHPEKYFADEGPMSLEALPIEVIGLEEQRSDSLGEYFIRVMLETQLDEPEAVSAAQGWGGDRLTYYEGQQTYLFTWQSLWDSNQDAAELFKAFLEMLQRNDGTKMDGQLWLVKGRYFSVILSSEEVLTVVSPDRQMLESVLTANTKAVK